MRAVHAYEEKEVTSRGADTEFNLGLGSLLAIFLGLALVCGVFFGFGYNLGHRGQAAASMTVNESPRMEAPAVAPKPTPQSLQHPEDADRVVLPVNSGPQQNAAKKVSEMTSAGSVPAEAANSTQHDSARVAALPGPPPVPQVTLAGGTIMVQIAAVKTNADAQALASALRKNGFTPAIRSESQDKLMHVQLGPFANREDARTMRQQLVNAGYNAFIK